MPTQVYLTIIRYRSIGIIMGFFSMMLFRLPLWLNKSISFYKLMGCGKNGTFDIYPDLHQWAIFSIQQEVNKSDEHEIIIRELYGQFLATYISRFAKESYTISLTPVNGHGKWDGGNPFHYQQSNSISDQQPIAVLTRATIRLNKLKAFWKNVPSVSQVISTTPGFIFSVGIGEIPWIKQATFSVWKTEADMKSFAYRKNPHQDVVRKTHQEKWYSEEMFVRFRINYTCGSLRQVDPLAEIM